MKRQRPKYVGIWFSIKEKSHLKKLSKQKGITLSQLIRERSLSDYYRPSFPISQP